MIRRARSFRDDRFRPTRRQRARKRLLLRLLLIAGIGFTGWQWGGAALVHAKAWLAPVLIERAWAESRTHRTEVRPWPWADTWPIARLSVPALDIEQFVLAGANGASLPFGPGHLSGTALPGNTGTVVIAGHRDTHFAFLPKIEIGSLVMLESANGLRSTYRVREKKLVDSRSESIAAQPNAAELLLVTCEPETRFTSRGPMRLVVRATP